MDFFPYDLDHRWNALFAVLRVTERDGVELTDDGLLRATFGRVSLSTPIDNIKQTEVTGPHRWFMAVGLRLALTDDGLTFGTNHHRGLSITFADRVPKVVGPRDHSTLWVSVANPEGLAAAIESRQPGPRSG
jgi:hypothetical protein